MLPAKTGLVFLYSVPLKAEIKKDVPVFFFFFLCHAFSVHMSHRALLKCIFILYMCTVVALTQMHTAVLHVMHVYYMPC